MTLVLILITLAIVGWLIVTTYLNYRKVTGTVWQRLLSAADDSATLLWSKFMLLISALTGVLTNAADYFGDPGLSAAIKDVLQPQYVAYFAIFVTFITIWARHRDVK